MPIRLSRTEQQLSQKRYQRYALLNPLGANLTIGSVCTLLALHWGASDFQMGLLYAAIYLTGVFAIFTPALFQGMDATRITAASWWVRSLLAGGILLLPLSGNPSFKAWGLVAFIYIFLSIRAIGVSTLPSVLRAISGPRQLAAMNAGAFMRWYVGCLITSLLAWAVLSQRQRLGSEAAFMILFGTGFVFNLATSWSLSTLPPTGRLSRGSWSALLEGFAEVKGNRAYREVVWVTLLQVPMAIAAAYQVNHLSVGLGFSPESITALAVAGILVSVVGARALVIIGSRIHIRPLLVGSHLFLIVFGAMWTWLDLFPAASRPTLAAVLFILSTLFLSVSGIVLSALSSERLPGKNAVSVSVMYQLAGVLAAFLGIVAIQVLGRSLPWTAWPGMHAYSHAFALWTALSVGVCAIAFVMVSGRFQELAQDLSQISPSNLLTVFRAHSVSISASSDPKDVRELENVLVSPVPASTRLLLEALRSPESRLRGAAYRALYQLPRRAAFPLVRDEALCVDSPLRNDAVSALGFLRFRASTVVLRRLRRDSEPAIAARAWKGLLRHGEPIDETALFACYRSCHRTLDRLDILWGLLDIGQTRLLLKAYGHEIQIASDPHWHRTVLVMIAESLGDDSRMAELLILERERPMAAWQELLEELPQKIAGLDREDWRGILKKSGQVVLPASARLPGGLRPTQATGLIGLLHCSRLMEGMKTA
ncbi:MAG: hypothetical protein J0L75_05555 [Spirochaetes bacterium]|nr:hypothetical protein [Spirochaetota bacterium]